MFLVLEGIDASGKSEVSERVADMLGGVLCSTPPEKYRALRKSVDPRVDLRKHYEFYQEAVTVASDEIRGLLASGKTVVCARYWFSTIAYHRAAGMVLDIAEFSALVQPDFTALLLVTPETQVKRARRRVGETGNIDGKQVELTNLFWQVLLESKLPFMALATDNIGIDQVSNILVSALLAHTNNPSLRRRSGQAPDE